MVPFRHADRASIRPFPRRTSSPSHEPTTSLTMNKPGRHRHLLLLASGFLAPNCVRRLRHPPRVLLLPRNIPSPGQIRPNREDLFPKSQIPLAPRESSPRRHPPLHIPKPLLRRHSRRRPGLEPILPPHTNPIRAQSPLPPYQPHPIGPILHRPRLRLPTRHIHGRPLGRPYREEMDPQARRCPRSRRQIEILLGLLRHRHPGVYACLRVGS